MQLVIPTPLVPLVLEEMHDSALSEGHMGIGRSLDKVRVGFPGNLCIPSCDQLGAILCPLQPT